MNMNKREAKAVLESFVYAGALTVGTVSLGGTLLYTGKMVENLMTGNIEGGFTSFMAGIGCFAVHRGLTRLSGKMKKGELVL